jgi:hypothetical protein
MRKDFVDDGILDKNEFKMSSFDLASLLTVAASIKIIKTCTFL